MLNRLIRKTHIVGFISLVGVASLSASAVHALAPERLQGETLQEMIEVLESRHYAKRSCSWMTSAETESWTQHSKYSISTKIS